MKKRLRWLCVPGFLALCAAVWLFFQPLTQTGGLLPNLAWTACAVVDAVGNETPFDPMNGPPELSEGERFRFTTVLPQREDFMSLGLISAGGGDTTLTLDGAHLWSGREAEGGESTLWLTLSPGGGETLTLELIPDGAQGLFPPIVQLTDDPTGQADSISYANYYAIPAGATALALVLLWGLFLLGAAEGRPLWKLLLLLFAAAELTAYPLFVGFGTTFFPVELLPFLTWRGWPLLTAAVLVAYLLLQRDLAFWRALGLAALCSVGTLLLCWGLSALSDGYLARYLPSLWAEVTAGYWDGLIYWLTLWLVTVCTCLAAISLVRTIYAAEASVQAMQIKNELIMENYQTLLEKNTETLCLRHEWKNQLLSLRLLQEKGDAEGMAARLRELEGELERLTPRLYTDNPAVNTILQKAASQADRQGISFTCQVQVPRELNIDERDLCTLLVNLLDNALEAAAQVQPTGKREIVCRLKLSRGFLAIYCENTYTGAVRLDPAGRLATTKANGEGHSFGLVQMRAVAEKYNSVLDISYDQERFTVQTALALPD